MGMCCDGFRTGNYSVRPIRAGPIRTPLVVRLIMATGVFLVLVHVALGTSKLITPSVPFGAWTLRLASFSSLPVNNGALCGCDGQLLESTKCSAGATLMTAVQVRLTACMNNYQPSHSWQRLRRCTQCRPSAGYPLSQPAKPRRILKTRGNSNGVLPHWYCDAAQVKPVVLAWRALRKSRRRIYTLLQLSTTSKHGVAWTTARLSDANRLPGFANFYFTCPTYGNGYTFFDASTRADRQQKIL